MDVCCLIHSRKISDNHFRGEILQFKIIVVTDSNLIGIEHEIIIDNYPSLIKISQFEHLIVRVYNHTCPRRCLKCQYFHCMSNIRVVGFTCLSLKKLENWLIMLWAFPLGLYCNVTDEILHLGVVYIPARCLHTCTVHPSKIGILF